MISHLRYNPKPLHGNPRLQAEVKSLLKLCCDVCHAKLAFFISWEDALHLAHHHLHGSRAFFSTEFSQYEERFSPWAVPYFSANNIKYHTLFQDLPFFKLYEYNQLLAVPFYSSYGSSEGFIGILYEESEKMPANATGTLNSFVNHIQNLRTKLIHQQDLPKIDLVPSPCFLIEVSKKSSKITNVQLNAACESFLQVIYGQNDFNTCTFLEMMGLDLQSLLDQTLYFEDKEEFEVNCRLKGLKSNKEFTLNLKFRFKTIDQSVYLWASIEDHSSLVEYKKQLDKILFDISHVLRRPVATMSGLTHLIEIDRLDEQKLKLLAKKIKTVSDEMDVFIKSIFNYYQYKRDQLE